MLMVFTNKRSKGQLRPFCPFIIPERRINMWVEKRKDNRYKFVEQYQDPLTDKKKRVSITYDKNASHTSKEAQLALEKKIQDTTQNSNINIKDVRLAELIRKFKINYKERVRSTTYTNKLLVLKTIEIGLGSD